MKQLNIYDLHNTINKKKHVRTNIYNSILNKCHNKIKQAAEKELISTFFNIPSYVVGLPLFDISECSKYIFDHLQQNGFKVSFLSLNIIHISWEITSNEPPAVKEQENLLLLNHIPDELLKKKISAGKNRKEKFILNVD
jgi:hypothetical protein